VLFESLVVLSLSLAVPVIGSQDFGKDSCPGKWTTSTHRKLDVAVCPLHVTIRPIKFGQATTRGGSKKGAITHAERETQALAAVTRTGTKQGTGERGD